MRAAIILGGATAVLALTGCATKGAAVDAGAVRDAVLADAHRHIASFNAHDADQAVSHELPDYVGMFHGAPNTIGVAADLATTRAEIADPAARVVLSDESVDVAAAGDMAIFRSTYAFTFTDPKTRKTGVEHGNWIVGYKAKDGAMKMAWGVVSDTGPAPAG